MKTKEKIDKVESVIYNAFEWIVRILLVFVTLLISVQVLLRAVFSYSIPWSEEVALMIFIYITFFTMAITVRHDQHLRVELFVSKFKRGGKQAIEFFDNLIMLVISLMMLYTGIQLVQYGVASIMPATRWPTSIIYLPTPICGALASIQQILRLTGISTSESARKFIEGADET